MSGAAGLAGLLLLVLGWFADNCGREPQVINQKWPNGWGLHEV